MMDAVMKAFIERKPMSAFLHLPITIVNDFLILLKPKEIF